MLNSDQKYANFCSEWSIVRYWIVAFRNLWTRSFLPIFSGCFCWQCDRFSVSQWNHTDNIWKSTGSRAVILITKTKIHTKTNVSWEVLHVGGLVQYCNISIANALELLQSSTKPSTCLVCSVFHNLWFEKLRYSSGNHIHSIYKIWSWVLFSVCCVSQTTTEVFGTFYNL